MAQRSSKETLSIFKKGTSPCMLCTDLYRERKLQHRHLGRVTVDSCRRSNRLKIYISAPTDASFAVHFFINRRGDCGLEMSIDVVEPRIHDHISNLRFSISPSAFFRDNTHAVEKLYSLAGDLADLGPDTLLFDVCCGTGTICLV